MINEVKTMKYDLDNKCVVITGGTSGIGEALAYAMIEQNARVVVCGRNQKKIDEINNYGKEHGVDLYAFRAEVDKVSEIKALCDYAVKTLGTIDVWVNNTGISVLSPFNKLSEEDFDKVVNTNFKSYWYGAAFASDVMKAQKKPGVIINTSSFNQHMPSAEKAIYCATKGAVGSITKVFAAELGKFGIRVVSVSPGYTLTPINEIELQRPGERERLSAAIPLKKFATTDDMVAAYMFLASDGAAYIDGVDLRVDGAKFAVQNPLWSWTFEGDC